MNTNQNDPKQLDCNLYTQATASFQNEINNDLNVKDASLSELLEEDDDGDKTTKDNRKACN